MKNTIRFSMLLAVSLNALAQDVPAECNLRKEPLLNDVSLRGRTPDYFFKPIWRTGPSDTRDEMSVIIEGANYTMNMRDGSTRQIPGPYDGVPTPDGQFIVIPTMNFLDRNGVSMGSQMINENEEGRLDGVYHSLGVLNTVPGPAGSKQVTYRGITDTSTGGSNLMYKEYTFKISGEGTKTLLSTSGEPKELCSNLGTSIKTPILSKNGKLLSAYSNTTGTTIIYEVVQVGGRSECRVKKDMGFATSKMEFSPDDNKVVFSMNSLPTTPSAVNWYAQPPQDSHNMNVFTYDFGTNDLTRISNQTSGNAYYPSFDSDGRSVVWMSQQVDDNGDENYSVRRSRVSDGRSMDFVDFSKVRGCDLTSPNVVKLMALGKLWESVCSQNDTKMSASALGTMSLAMTPENCRNLVNNNWENFKQSTGMAEEYIGADLGNNGGFTDEDSAKYMQMFTALSKADVLTTCTGGAATPTPSTAAPDEVAAEVAAPAAPATGASPTVSSCVGCHDGSGEAPAIPFDKPAELAPFKKQMLLQVMTGNMPRMMNLSPQQREDLIGYLRSIPDPKDQKKEDDE